MACLDCNLPHPECVCCRVAGKDTSRHCLCLYKGISNECIVHDTIWGITKEKWHAENKTPQEDQVPTIRTA